MDEERTLLLNRLSDRARELMAESGLSWREAWRVAEGEIGSVPRQSLVLRALRVVFLVLTGFVIWMGLSFGMALIPDHVASFSWSLGFTLMGFVFMPIAIVASILIARRFPTIPVPVMIALPVLVIGVPFLWDALT